MQSPWYALSNLKSPIGVSSYSVNLLEKLPQELKGKLPTVAEIETELSGKQRAKKPRKMKGVRGS